LIDGVRLNVGPFEVTPIITPAEEPLLITSLDMITISPGANDTMVLSVDNNMETRVTVITVENLLPTGIIVIAIGAIILSIWKVWFRKPK